jgi:transposase
MWTETTRRKYEREGERYASDLTDAEWALIEPHMPPAKRLGRPRATELRSVLEAILYIARTGCQWRMLPKEFPPFTTVQGYFYDWFYDWRDNGLFETINFHLLLQAREAAGRDASPSAGVIDSQSVKTTESGGPRGEPDGVDGPLTASVCQSWVVDNANGREPSMTEVTTIGLDLAKTIFQVHGVNASGAVTMRRAMRRSRVLAFFGKLPPCLVGIEACATAHYWAREIAQLGHDVRLIAPAYAEAYVRRNKNDAADAEAICEAVSRPSMRFVAIKTETQQAAAGVHRVREMLVKQRTMLINTLRGLMAEYGVVVAERPRHVDELVAILADPADERIPAPLHGGLLAIVETLRSLEHRIERIEKQIVSWGRDNAACRHLITIPGCGPILSTAMAAMVVNPAGFTSGRHFAASLGLVPRQDGTGGKVKLGPISKRGNGYLRRLLVSGAMAVLCGKRAKEDPWLAKLLETKERKVVACALANKMARVGWAVMMRQEDFRSRRRDQPCPDLNQLGAVLPTDQVPWAEGPRRQDRCARACGGGLRPVLTATARGDTGDPGRDGETAR